MSSNRRISNLTPALGSWRSGHHDYAATASTYSPNNYETSQTPPPMFPHSTPTGNIMDASRGTQNPRQWIEERAITGPLGYSLSRFPAQSHSPRQILLLNGGMAREVNPRQRRMIQESPPRYLGQRSFPIPTTYEETESRLFQDGEKNALKMLKKEIYNSPPKSITRRLSMFYRDRDQGKSLSERTVQKDDDEDGKRCAVCLEDFEPRQEVMVTPCNHMFHEECIVPWVKSNNQCPVCRFTFSKREQTRERATPLDNYNIADMAANNLFAGELISVIRAMEEAFEWGGLVP